MSVESSGNTCRKLTNNKNEIRKRVVENRKRVVVKRDTDITNHLR